MPKEYVFWFHLIKRKALYFNFFWNIPKNLIRVVVTENQIRSDDSIGQIDSQEILAIDLPNIAQIKWSVSSPGSIGYITIITQETERYYLTPVNPLDPTLLLVQGNIDELIAFCNVVNALRTNHIPDFDENPYVRQFQKEGTSVYYKNKKDIHWDKNISPWEYYYEFVPASEDKKRRLVVKVFKILVLSALTIAVLGFLYALYTNFKW